MFKQRERSGSSHFDDLNGTATTTKESIEVLPAVPTYDVSWAAENPAGKSELKSPATVAADRSAQSSPVKPLNGQSLYAGGVDGMHSMAPGQKSTRTSNDGTTCSFTEERKMFSLHV